MRTHMIGWTIAAILAGCGSSKPPPQSSPTPTPTGDPTTIAPDRKSLTKEECDAQGGAVVGDIGDGATLRPDYVCPSGKPPLGSIAPPAGGPTPIEGAVCCPQ
jgi:hypothetical protein